MEISKYKMEFGWENDEGLGDMLIQQIIDGVKTATCGFKVQYLEVDIKEFYESEGQIVTVIDKFGQPRCNVRILKSFETSFGNPDPCLVEGEGDGNDVKKFQEDHRIAWENMVEGISLTKETILMAQVFEFVGVF